MKVLLILLVLLAAAYYFFVYEKGPGKTTTAPTEAAAGANATPSAAAADNHSFDGVVALLRTEMNAVPAPLDGPGPNLANAQSIRRKVRPYVNTHPEYATLTEACDLIIQANAQRGAFQDSCRSEQSRLGFKTALTHDTSIGAALPKGKSTPPPTPTDQTQAAVHQRFENSWASYRAQTDRQVQGLLNSLAGKHL